MRKVQRAPTLKWVKYGNDFRLMDSSDRLLANVRGVWVNSRDRWGQVKGSPRALGWVVTIYRYTAHLQRDLMRLRRDGTFGHYGMFLGDERHWFKSASAAKTAARREAIALNDL